MTELAKDFISLPSEYQEVLLLAQDMNNIQISPLQELKGGRTGACLYLVSVSSPGSNQLQHLILKVDHKNKKAISDELERHSIALSQAPSEVARNHIANLAFKRVELNDTVAIFYAIAGESLHHYQSLGTLQKQSKLEKIFSITTELLLTEWNANLVFEQLVHPQKLLERWLGYRIKPEGNIGKFLEEFCKIPFDIPGLMIQGNILPNPLVYARENKLWNSVRPIDIIVGFQHGDLNIGNILVKFNENETELTGYYLIDFALFKAGTPLLYDQLYLEMSYLLREVTRISLTKWIDLILHFAVKDIVDPLQVPVELAGACSVINAGRKAFGNWVQSYYPSLSDDLWGQFWLAGVAAGLNFCNKTVLNEEERIAGLIFAAVHLKRFHSIFGVSLPKEVRHLDIENQGRETYSLHTKTSGTNPCHNLPVSTTTIIGREQEMALIHELLEREDTRMLTLTGPGGTGKTRLAIQVVINLKNGYADGIYFVDLAPIREPDLVLAAVARTLGLRETTNKSLRESLRTDLENKRILLLLDNFEQVTSAGPRMVELIQDCPHVTLLVTSREALHVRGEHVLPIPPLTLPGTDIKGQSAEQLRQFEAVRLFLERARAVKPDFKITNENAVAIAGICARLDGLPLAIELAAARIKLFSPEILLKRVGSRLNLLRGGARDLPARQQTIRDTIDWSYELLDKGEEQLFAVLSVFQNCTFSEVEAAAGRIQQLNEAGIDLMDGLTSLIEKSLLREAGQGTGEPRFLMLETIREYADEKLHANPELRSEAFKAHAVYFAEFIRQQYERLAGNQREEALRDIEPDIENIRIAWKYWVEKGDTEQLNKFTNSLWLLYDALGWFSAIAELTTDLLNMLKSTPSTPERAQQEILLQTSLARVLMSIQGCSTEVEGAYTHALELCQRFGEIPQLFPVLRSLASFYVYVGNLEKSGQFGVQILELSEQLNDINMKVEGHMVFGYSTAFCGNLKLGLEHLEKGIDGYNPDLRRGHTFRFGYNPGVTCRTASALFLWMLGSPDQALRRTDNAITFAKKLNHPSSIAYAMFHTGLLHHWRQEEEIVLNYAQAVLDIAEKYEYQIWKAVATCLLGAAHSGLGYAEDGLMEIKRGMEKYSESKNPPIFWPLLLQLRAGSCIQAKHPEEALTTISEAVEIIGPGTGNPLLSDFLRMKGDILLMVSPENEDEAVSLFLRALEISGKQQASMFELQAAVSLTRLWSYNGKADQARQLLGKALEKFSEGFTTKNLSEARILLSELA